MGNSTETVSASWFETIIASLQGRMERPHMFSGFHLLFLGLLIAACVLVVWRRKTLTDKTIDLVMWISATVMILFEVYKQLVFSYQGDGTWHYEWYIFPFQFCSTPMYVMLVGALVKNKTVKNACRAFMATYGLFGGATVMVYPEIVFNSMIGINIQTMIHHGLMFVVGVMLYVSGAVKATPKSTFRAIPVFLILIVTAIILNLAVYPSIADQEAQAFNMFYISPYFPCELPLLMDIQKIVPYPVFLLIYVLGFTGIAFLMPTIALGISKLKKQPVNETEQAAEEPVEETANETTNNE